MKTGAEICRQTSHTIY